MDEVSRNQKVRGVITLIIILLVTLFTWFGAVAYQQTNIWTHEAQSIEDEFKVHALDYLNAYNKANPDEAIKFTSDIVDSYNKHLDTLNSWEPYEEFEPQLFTLAAERMPYVSSYNTALNETLVGKIRKLFGTDEREFITMIVDHEHSDTE